MDTENVEIIKAMVKTGLGIGIVPYQAVAREVRAGQLFCTRIEGHELVRETGWVYARANRTPRAYPRAAARRFEFVRGKLRLAPPRPWRGRRDDGRSHDANEMGPIGSFYFRWDVGRMYPCIGGDMSNERDRVISITSIRSRMAGLRRPSAAAGHLAARPDSRRGRNERATLRPRDARSAEPRTRRPESRAELRAITDLEDRAARPAVTDNVAAVPLDNRLDNRQPKPAAAGDAGARRVRLVKAIEDVRQMLRRRCRGPLCHRQHDALRSTGRAARRSRSSIPAARSGSRWRRDSAAPARGGRDRRRRSPRPARSRVSIGTPAASQRAPVPRARRARTAAQPTPAPSSASRRRLRAAPDPADRR